MNKKGDNHFLSSEILGVVLAIFGIVILLLLASKFYGLFDTKTEIEQATAHMKTIQRTIEKVKASGGSEEYLLTGPNGWILTAWPSQGHYYCELKVGTSSVPSGVYSLAFAEYNGEMPNDCADKGWKACTCLCKKNSDSNFISSCNELSACAKSTAEEVTINSSPKGDELCIEFVMRNEYIYISGSQNILISSENNKLRITRA